MNGIFTFCSSKGKEKCNKQNKKGKDFSYQKENMYQTEILTLPFSTMYTADIVLIK